MLAACGGERDGLVCLSVRSAFDLLLQALALAPGDEIAVSAITHPDMARIIAAHGLRALPVDLDPATLAPRTELLEQALRPRTRAVLVAHLFGGRVDLAPLADLARRRELLLIEDCAQSLRGHADGGSSAADLSLFSFGSIKRATALGGCVVRVRDRGLRERMAAIQSAWPVQSRREYAARAVKFSALVLLTRPRSYWVLARTLEALGRDFDAVVSGAVRGFPGADLVGRIRRRPSAPLLALLERRLRRFDAERLAARIRLAERVADALPETLFQPGGAALDRTYWVFPVGTSDRTALISRLRAAGFDAATATTSIVAIAAPADRAELAPSAAADLLERIVFLPVYPELDEREVGRLIAALQ